MDMLSTFIAGVRCLMPRAMEPHSLSSINGSDTLNIAESLEMHLRYDHQELTFRFLIKRISQKEVNDGTQMRWTTTAQHKTKNRT